MTDTAIEGFEQVEIYDETRGHKVTFQGKEAGYDTRTEAMAHVTPKGAIAVLWNDPLTIYDDFAAFKAEPGRECGLIAQVADFLGENYAEELDI